MTNRSSVYDSNNDVSSETLEVGDRIDSPGCSHNTSADEASRHWVNAVPGCTSESVGENDWVVDHPCRL